MFLIAPHESFVSLDNDRNTYFPIERCYAPRNEAMVFGSSITALPQGVDAIAFTMRPETTLELFLAAAFTDAGDSPWGWCVGALERGERAFENRAFITPLKSNARTPRVETLRCWCHLDNAIVFEDGVTGFKDGIPSDIASLCVHDLLKPGDLVFWTLHAFPEKDARKHRLEFGVSGVGILKLDLD